jgi:hypothetical protein
MGSKGPWRPPTSRGRPRNGQPPFRSPTFGFPSASFAIRVPSLGVGHLSASLSSAGRCTQPRVQLLCPFVPRLLNSTLEKHSLYQNLHEAVATMPPLPWTRPPYPPLWTSGPDQPCRNAGHLHQNDHDHLHLPLHSHSKQPHHPPLPTSHRRSAISWCGQCLLLRVQHLNVSSNIAPVLTSIRSLRPPLLDIHFTFHIPSAILRHHNVRDMVRITPENMVMWDG